MTGEDYTIRQLDQVAKDTRLPAYGTKVERFERLVQALGRAGSRFPLAPQNPIIIIN
jgi:hypothetical protein